MSYRSLVDRLESIRAQLADAGIGRDDRIVIVLPNGLAMATMLLAVISDAIAAPLNPAYTADEFSFYLDDLRPRAVIVTETTDSAVRDVARSRSVRVIELRGESLCLQDGGTPVAASSRRPASRDDHALLLHTSGTTNRPKLVPLTHGNLSTSAQNVAASLELTSADRCFNMMPLFHVHGFVGALLSSLCSGGSVVCTAGFRASKTINWMNKFEPTWYTAVPTIHGAVLDSLDAESPRPTLRFIRSSSAALPSTTRARLEEAFAAPVVEAYGMTEAAHQIASNPWKGARKLGTVGPATGPEIALLGDGAITRSAGATGEIVIRGANVMTAYLDNPAANADAFLDGWFRTGDAGCLDAQGYLTITGRLKEVINRGGEKIAPTEVEEALLAHADVERAVVFATPHPRLGQDVAAAVVVRSASTLSRAELRRFVAIKVAPFKVPHHIVFVDEIPTGSTGKVQRVGLAARLGVAASNGDDRHFVEPRDDVERRVAEIFSDVLHLDAAVSVVDDFVALGADSLHFEELLAEVQREFDRTLPASAMLHEPTVEHLAALLRDDDTEVGDDPIVIPIQTDGARPPLFCVMRAGTLVTARHFVPELGGDQPVYGVWMPAMHGDKDAAGSVEEIAAACRRAISDVQPRGPYFFFGYSTGGLVAYELARQCTAVGERVGLVVMADTPYPVPLPSLRDRVAKLFSREGLPVAMRRLHQFARRVPAVRVLAKPQPPTELEVRAHEFAAVGVDMYATIRREREYVSTDRPAAAPVVLFSCRPTMEEICHGSRVLGWERYVQDDWEVVEVPGSHDTMLGEPHVHTLAARLASCLVAAQRTAG
jgi:acyl-CoA synthetase (AMP-forming)/AMP-acid ligase II/thioesterase domain-containing protein/acyl carrier protein